MEAESVATIIIGIIIIPVLGWLLIKTIKHGETLVLLGTHQDDTNAKLDTLVQSFDKMNNKLDLFLKTELDAFKKLSEESTHAINKITSVKK